MCDILEWAKLLYSGKKSEEGSVLRGGGGDWLETGKREHSRVMAMFSILTDVWVTTQHGTLNFVHT